MSRKHPVIAITGSSGAGTTTARRAFDDIFRREGIHAEFVEGDSFFRYNRSDMQVALKASIEAGAPISHFGPQANLFDKLEALFREYGESGTGQLRRYIKDGQQYVDYEQESGVFTPWQSVSNKSDLLLYEGMHGGVVASSWTRRRMSPSHNPKVIKERRSARSSSGVDVAQYVDLLLGVVPSVNLEWIQKIQRDCGKKGCSADSVTATILRRMHDYIYFIVPQFSLTDINFQRVPLVDTSNPFIARDVPALDESIVVIRFREPKKHDFPMLMRKIEGAYMSRPNTLVVPGGKMGHAMEVVCTPIIHRMMEEKSRQKKQGPD